MKILPAHELPELPRDVKALVEDGVYSLCEIRVAGAQYLLKTKNKFYFLSPSGGVVPAAGRDPRSVEIVRAVSFSGASDVEVHVSFGGGRLQ